MTKDAAGVEYVVYGDELGEVIIRTMPFLDNPRKQGVVKDASVNTVCVSKTGKFIISGCSDGELSVIAETI